MSVSRRSMKGHLKRAVEIASAIAAKRHLLRRTGAPGKSIVSMELERVWH
jgi:hypothetical protein